ncbi:DUF29 domain-containing protein [Candidatus Nitrosacidococcus tergens]|uniref:DUF29 domain-containing protein n=1 Tax=Candidatus Nitrosacidococcus tergens TaxID=553981 RepID=A0A7G1Q9U7_9GAMM|nr:DUF29 domain-containing protein [Candidatus Nitrosacidococcus tergens]CAB1275895.1 conserved protein of unknown function [Candidatus Nitrosacidococcus tergens]
MSNITYNTDFYGWIQETAKLLRQGRISEVDMEHIIEELEDMGRSERRGLESRLTVLLAHLLKWQYQPEHRSYSWRGTIAEQRLQIRKLIVKNPSLNPELKEAVLEAYEAAVMRAYTETGLVPKTFPTTFQHTGWTVEQILDDGFYPE